MLEIKTVIILISPSTWFFVNVTDCTSNMKLGIQLNHKKGEAEGERVAAAMVEE